MWRKNSNMKEEGVQQQMGAMGEEIDELVEEIDDTVEQNVDEKMTPWRRRSSSSRWLRGSVTWSTSP